MLPLYAHETQGHMCKHADVHYTEQKVLRVALRRWGDDESVLRHWSHSRHWHHTVSKISGEKKNGAVYVVQAAEVNHDGARPPSRPPTPRPPPPPPTPNLLQAWVTSGGVKKPIHRRRWLEKTGGPACQAFHSTQWTHYYDIYKGSKRDTTWYESEKRLSSQHDCQKVEAKPQTNIRVKRTKFKHILLNLWMHI